MPTYNQAAAVEDRDGRPVKVDALGCALEANNEDTLKPNDSQASASSLLTRFLRQERTRSAEYRAEYRRLLDRICCNLDSDDHHDTNKNKGLDLLVVLDELRCQSQRVAALEKNVHDLEDALLHVTTTSSSSSQSPAKEEVGHHRRQGDGVATAPAAVVTTDVAGAVEDGTKKSNGNTNITQRDQEDNEDPCFLSGSMTLQPLSPDDIGARRRPSDASPSRGFGDTEGEAGLVYSPARDDTRLATSLTTVSPSSQSLLVTPLSAGGGGSGVRGGPASAPSRCVSQDDPPAATRDGSATSVGDVALRSKYDSLKAKYFSLKASLVSSLEHSLSVERAWRRLWRHYASEHGTWRCSLRVAAEGLVVPFSSPPRATPAGASTSTSSYANTTSATVVTCGEGPRRAKLDSVFDRHRSQWDVAQDVVASLLPVSLCGGDCCVILYGGTGSGRTMQAHDVLVAALLSLAPSSSSSSSIAMALTVTVCDADDIWSLPRRELSTQELQRLTSSSSSSLSSADGFASPVEVAGAILGPIFHERRQRYPSCHMIVSIEVTSHVMERGGGTTTGMTQHHQRSSSTSTTASAPVTSPPQRRVNSGAVRFTVVDAVAPPPSSDGSSCARDQLEEDVVALVRSLRILSCTSCYNTVTPLQGERRYETASPLCAALHAIHQPSSSSSSSYPIVQTHLIAAVGANSSLDERWATIAFAARVRQSAVMRVPQTQPSSSFQQAASAGQSPHGGGERNSTAAGVSSPTPNYHRYDDEVVGYLDWGP